MIAAEFMDLPESATTELIEMGGDLFPDASGWGQRASYLKDPKLPLVFFGRIRDFFH